MDCSTKASHCLSDGGPVRPRTGRKERTYGTATTASPSVDHPIVQHKAGHPARQAHVLERVPRCRARALAVRGLRGYPRPARSQNVFIQTPICALRCQADQPASKMAIVPILRAGLGMVDGALEVIPRPRVGHLGMQRDERDPRARELLRRSCPDGIAQPPRLRASIPMLATGGSAEAAVKYLREAGVSNTIRSSCLVAGPGGHRASARRRRLIVIIYTCAIDDGLNENAYIVPGLGDAGDRIFGTE
ncbi:MAG: uracil phosphoribosyltransferase [Adlercreutzia equolifaciens]